MRDIVPTYLCTYRSFCIGDVRSDKLVHLPVLWSVKYPMLLFFGHLRNGSVPFFHNLVVPSIYYILKTLILWRCIRVVPVPSYIYVISRYVCKFAPVSLTFFSTSFSSIEKKTQEGGSNLVLTVVYIVVRGLSKSTCFSFIRFFYLYKFIFRYIFMLLPFMTFRTLKRFGTWQTLYVNVCRGTQKSRRGRHPLCDSARFVTPPGLHHLQRYWLGLYGAASPFLSRRGSRITCCPG